MSIAIIDYEAGNLRSVEKAFGALGFAAKITSNPEEILSAKGVVLPGVGSNDAALLKLRESKLDQVINEIVSKNMPFLGICLGYQMLFESSEEGMLPGLAIFKGTVKKFDFDVSVPSSKLSIPHMGWNGLLLNPDNNAPIYSGIPNGSMVYFAHSYYPDPIDRKLVATETDYGIKFCSSIAKDNLFALQFHPEKSGSIGLKILENFGKLCLK